MSIRPHVQQHSLVLPDGVRIDRLPLGLANDQWWMVMVFSGPPGPMSVLEDGRGFYRDWLPQTVHLLGPREPFSAFHSGGGGGGDRRGRAVDYDALYRFESIPTLTITYTHEGTVIDEEHLDLSLD